MNYKQKYKSALKWMRSIYPTMQGAEKEDAEHYFPELKESEDEKIRKELLQHCINRRDGKQICVDANDYRRWAAWLEKQGVQKLIKQDTEVNDLWVYIREWNDKFGRLPKDEDELTSCIDYVMKRQKPTACSEKDERMIETIIYDLERHGGKEESSYSAEINWLKSLKDKAQPQSHQECGEEDEKQIRQIERIVKDSGASTNLQKKISDWLKSIKPNHWKPNEEQMEAIKYFINFHRPQANASIEGWKEFKHLESLYNDIKNFES